MLIESNTVLYIFIHIFSISNSYLFLTNLDPPSRNRHNRTTIYVQYSQLYTSYEYLKYLEKEGTNRFQHMVNEELANRERVKEQITKQRGIWNAEAERQFNVIFEEFDEWIKPYRLDLYKTYIKPRKDLEKRMIDLSLPLQGGYGLNFFEYLK